MNFKGVFLSVLLAASVGGADEGRRSSIYVGIEFGGALILNAPSDYEMGYGRGFQLGYRRGTVGIEVLFGQSYTSSPSVDELSAINTSGNIGYFATGLRYYFGLRSISASVFGGIARMSVPVLAQGELGGISSKSLAGIGALGGFGISIPLRRGALEWFVDGRLGMGYWELPPSSYYKNVRNEGGGITADVVTESANPILGSLTSGFRMVF